MSKENVLPETDDGIEDDPHDTVNFNVDPYDLNFDDKEDAEDDDEEDDKSTTEASQLPFWHWKKPLLLGFSLPVIMGVIAIAGGGVWLTSGGDSHTQPSSDITLQAAESSLPPSRARHHQNDMLVSQANNLPADRVEDIQPLAPVEPSTGAKMSEQLAILTQAQNTGFTQLNAALAKDEEALKNLLARVSKLEEEKVAAVKQASVSTPSATTEATGTGKLKNSKNSTQKTATTARPHKGTSAISGMRIVSMDSGMAWIKWRDSTWSVRQGDSLGTVTINAIRPDLRVVETSGGTIR